MSRLTFPLPWATMAGAAWSVLDATGMRALCVLDPEDNPPRYDEGTIRAHGFALLVNTVARGHLDDSGGILHAYGEWSQHMMHPDGVVPSPCTVCVALADMGVLPAAQGGTDRG